MVLNYNIPIHIVFMKNVSSHLNCNYIYIYIYIYMSIINDIHYLDCQVDFAMDVFKNLYPDQDVPEGLLILSDSV